MSKRNRNRNREQELRESLGVVPLFLCVRAAVGVLVGRPRERHRHHAAVVPHGLRRRDHAFGARSRRHPERRRRHGSGRSDDRTRGLEDPGRLRSVLDVNALRGARIGYIASVWVDPFGTTGTTYAERAALQFLVDAGATIVPMGVLAGGTDTPPSPADTTTGNLTQEGWRLYIDAHPELAAQGFRIFTAVDVSCSQVKIAYTRADPSACAVAPAARMTQGELDAKRAQRVIRQVAAKGWMDAAGVDAVVYPGLLSDMSLNDGGGGRSPFGRRDTPSASYGIPTVVCPAGYNDRGQPIDIELMGRAWDDPKLVGYAYAFEQRANAAGRGHVVPTTAPALPFRALGAGTIGR